MHKLVYTDERDLRTYESLPEKDFKEFFMAYFKYNKGDKIEMTDFTNPITFALFNSYIPKLDKNEDTYNKKVNASRENGKKGGRPKKQTPMEPNDDFKVEPAIEYRGLSHVNPNIIPQEEFISDEQKYGPDVMDLIEDNPEIITALKSVVGYNSGDIDKEYQAKMANTKIDQIVRTKNNDKDFIRRVENFCADFIREYTEHILNNNNNDLKEF